MDEFTLRGSDGVEVFCRRWLPSGEPHASIVVVHGAAEHSGRYARVAEVLRAEGYAVYALDLRGHGRTASPTEGGLIGAGGMPAVIGDVEALLRRARSENGDAPAYLLGHSMGTAVVQALVVRTPDLVDGYVLSGTMGPTAGADEFVAGMRAALDAGMADVPLDASASGASFEPGRTPYDWLSRDPDEVDKYIADPLCGDGNALTYGYAAAVLDTVLEVMEPDAIARISPRIPVLLLTGDADPVSENGAQVRELERRLRDAGLEVTARYYAGARHEVLNETNRDEVHADLVAWLATSRAPG